MYGSRGRDSPITVWRGFLAGPAKVRPRVLCVVCGEAVAGSQFSASLQSGLLLPVLVPRPLAQGVSGLG